MTPIPSLLNYLLAATTVTAERVCPRLKAITYADWKVPNPLQL
jgi:hypothetical protein